MNLEFVITFGVCALIVGGVSHFLAYVIPYNKILAEFDARRANAKK